MIKPVTNKPTNVFWVMVEKEMGDIIRSWRFIIMLGLIALTCFGSTYSAFIAIKEGLTKPNVDNDFFFLQLFSTSNGVMPSFFEFIAFLGPLLGISLGFDAVNSEHNKGTLSRTLAQPVPRDYILNAKFIGALSVIALLLFSLSFMVIGTGLIILGLPPTVEEFIRIMIFSVIGVIYVGFWLNLSIFFSVKFKQPATSALSGIAIWLFFTVFYPLIVNIILKGTQPGKMAGPKAVFLFEKMRFALLQVMPNQLFSEATSTLLMPNIRSIGPLTREQVVGAIPGSLPIGQSIMVIWPQLIGLLAATLFFFFISYLVFMRREIRSR